MANKRLLSWAGTAAACAFIALAIWLFIRTVHRYDPAEVLARFRQIPAYRIALAGLCVALCYLVQAAYDFLAARAVGVGVSAPRAILAGFVGNSLTNNIGFSLVTGISIRYRYYLAWGFGALQIAKVIALGKVAFLGGLLTATGLFQLIAPVDVPIDLPGNLSPRVMGALLLLPPAALLAWNGLSRSRDLVLGRFRMERPPQALLALAIATAAAHFAFAAAALFYLLPDGELHAAGFATPFAFLGTFMAIKFAAMFLPVPGNLGVLEAAAMAVLVPALHDYSVLGALLAFRLVFYVAPFAVALIVMAAFELSARTGLLPSLLRRRRERRLA